MSTAEVEPQPDNNAHSAQDVQKMLAELKGESKPETVAASASAEKDDPGHANNGDVKASEKNDPLGSNGVKDSNDRNEEEAKEEKGADGADGDDRERSRGYRPSRGGGRGRGGARGRGNFKSYKENIKSDFTAQQETDDPVMIRKQVRFPLVLLFDLRLTINQLRRLNSTFLTQICRWTNSSSPKLAAARISLSISKSFTLSNACAISNLSPPLLLRLKNPNFSS